MWTPKRMVLLACGFLALCGAYAGYASTYVGRIDGLPPLPQAYWPAPGDKLPPGPPTGPVVRSNILRKLQSAFGDRCQEVDWPIQLLIHAKNMVLASQAFTVLDDGRVCLRPLSVALFGKPRGDGKPDEMNSIRGEVAYLTFDRPVKNISELSGRKVVGAELCGRIEVRNNRRKKERDDDLVVRVPTGHLYYSEGKGLIWTDARVTLEDHKSKPRPHTVHGQGLEMELLAEEPAPRPGGARRGGSPAFTGVRRVVLHRDVVMDFYLDGRSEFPAGARPAGVMGPGKPPATPGKDRPAEKSHVRIDCPGRFQYDLFKDHDLATFDVAAPGQPPRANAPLHVDVVREHDNGGTDHLVCKHLVLRLKRKEGARSAGSAEQGVEVETAHATSPGNDVVLTSDSEKLRACGNDFFHDALRHLSVLKGTPETEVERDGSVITAREVQIRDVPPAGAPPGGKGHQELAARGPGKIHVYDKAAKKSNIHAFWKDRLTSTKDGEEDLLVLAGSARFVDDEHEQTLEADVLKVWFDPRRQPKEGAKSPGGSQQPRPQHVDASGHVGARSRDMVIRDTGQLVVWFEDVPSEKALSAATPDKGGGKGPPGRAPAGPAGAPARVTGLSGAGKPAATAAGGREEPRPIHLSARSIEARVVRSPERNTLRKLWCQGSVSVHQDAARPGERGTQIEGDTLQMWYHPEGNELEVTGDLAQLQTDKIRIWGPEVKIDQAKNKAWVDGSGAMMLNSDTDFQGKKLRKEVPLTIHWYRSMVFYGEGDSGLAFADFHGLIQAEQEEARMACDHLTVEFDRAVSLREGNRAGQPAPKVRTLVCDRDVRVEDSTLEGGVLARYQFLTAPVVHMIALEPEDPPPGGGPARAAEGNLVTASGPGAVRYYQGSGSDLMAAPARPRSSGPPGRTTAAKAAPAGKTPGKKEDEGPKLTYVSFRRRMDANSRTNSARFWEGVRVLSLPWPRDKNPNEALDLDSYLVKLPPGAMFLRCDNLRVADQGEKGKPNQEMQAEGNVYVQAQDFYGWAAVMHYNQAKDQIILDGRAGPPARLHKQKGGPGSPWETIEAKKILYNRTTGEYRVERAESISGASLPTARPAAPPPARPN